MASSGYNSIEGEYKSEDKKVQSKSSKIVTTYGEYLMTQSIGIKSTVNQNLSSSAQEVSYTSNQMPKSSKIVSTYREYPMTQSVGIKSTVDQNLASST